MENNQAETAFLLPTGDPARFGLRWFTPGMEVDLCGHATLASAHVLLAEMGLDAPALTFDTRSGPLVVTRAGEGYEMDFPADPPRRTARPPGLSEALGVEPVEVWAGRYLVAVLDDAAAVHALAPDIRALGPIQGEAGEVGQVIVCAAAGPSDTVDVVDRFFGPGWGVDEDPATGSAQCIPAPLHADQPAPATGPGPVGNVGRVLKAPRRPFDDGAREGLREDVKAAELRAERVLMEALESLSGPAEAVDVPAALRRAAMAWSGAAPAAALDRLAKALA